jgi:hypothetical protein
MVSETCVLDCWRNQALALIDCLPGTPEEDVGATDDLIVSY